MKQTPATTPKPAAHADESPLLERLLFYVLLAVLCVRPLISESPERTDLPFIPGGGGISPAVTVWLDSLALTAAAAALARTWRRGMIRRGVTVAIVLLAAALVVSVFAANNKRLALNTGWSLWIATLSGAALVCLMRASWMPRLLLAAVLATACTTGVKCVLQVTYEYKDLLEYWQEHKEELVPPDMAPDDPMLVNFERRMQSGEAVGYQAHPNVTGSLLATAFLVAAGLTIGLLGSRVIPLVGERIAAGVMAGAMAALSAVALWMTGSLGAIVAGGMGVVALLVFGLWHTRFGAWAGRVTVLLIVGYAAVIGGAAAFGVRHGTLPHPSLAFRWYYWTAAMRAYLDAPLTGIGRDNFVDAYLLHKPPESTEDVRDPHNIWLALLVEMGPLGLLGAGLLLALCVHCALRRLAVTTPARDPPEITLGMMLPAAAFILPLHLLFSGALLEGSPLILWLAEVAVAWVLVLVLSVRLFEALATSPAAEGWLAAGLAAALLAALLHGLLDFALLTPAGWSLFAAVAAAACALRAPASGPARDAAPAPLVLAAGLLICTHLYLVTVPTMRTEFRLARMQPSALDPSDFDACLNVLRLGEAAVDADPLDPSGAADVSRLAMYLARNPNFSGENRLTLLDRARHFALVALHRHPHSSTAHARLARIYEDSVEPCLLAAQPDDAVRAAEKAAEYWQAAAELDPTNPRKHISAGEAWFHWWEETDDPAVARIAIEHLSAALCIDAARPPEDVIRLRPPELARIWRCLRPLEDAGLSASSTSAPTTSTAPAAP
ncbi:MAG: O-antigen ligase family protein [Phycisphaerae bacterium]|jgi:O-antigen ligase